MINREVQELENRWKTDQRWTGIERPYGAEEVLRLRCSIKVEHTLARLGAERLWKLLHEEPYIAERLLGVRDEARARVRVAQVGLQGDHDPARDAVNILPGGKVVVIVGALDAWLNQQGATADAEEAQSSSAIDQANAERDIAVLLERPA